MYHNIHAGRLRHLVEIKATNTDTDEYGRPISEEFAIQARAHVRTMSGRELEDYGTTTTSTVITVLMWYDGRINDKQVLIWNGVSYEVNHVRPDDYFKSMVLTCEVLKK
ncbi:head closure Hc1 [Vibrio phage D63]